MRVAPLGRTRRRWMWRMNNPQRGFVPQVGAIGFQADFVHACQRLITIAPAAWKGAVSRVATAMPLAAAMAAM